MKLYHGSNIIIEQIDLSKCKPYKDFGQGFYLTEIKEQAEQILLHNSPTTVGKSLKVKFLKCIMSLFVVFEYATN